MAQPELRDEMKTFVKSGNVKYINVEEPPNTLTPRDSVRSRSRKGSARGKATRKSKLGDTVYF